MNATFRKSLGEVGMRKRSIRARVFVRAAGAVLLGVCAPLFFVLGVSVLGFVLFCAGGSMAYAEYSARKLLPQIIREVAEKYGVSPVALEADVMKHLDSAQPTEA